MPAPPRSRASRIDSTQQLTLSAALTAGDSLLLSEDDTGGKSVVAGTVDRLVALLADENAPDKNYVDVMLKTHHYFIESHRVRSTPHVQAHPHAHAHARIRAGLGGTFLCRGESDVHIFEIG